MYIVLFDSGAKGPEPVYAVRPHVYNDFETADRECSRVAREFKVRAWIIEAQRPPCQPQLELVAQNVDGSETVIGDV